LIQRAAALLSELPPPAPAAEILPLLAPLSEDAFTIEREDGAWIVGGKRIERVAAMTNWNYYEAIARFQRILEAMGIRQALAQAGLALVLESLTVPGEHVLVESPCYVGVLALIRAMGREAVPVAPRRGRAGTDAWGMSWP